MILFANKPDRLPSAQEALPGRAEPLALDARHFVSGRSMLAPFPDGTETLYFGMGCFWGAERLFWQIEGVYVTAVGYQGGLTPNPSYDEVCSGRTGHAEMVMVVYDPQILSTPDLLATFFEEHDPTQGMRQGNDRGTQYRSAVYYTTAAQKAAVTESAASYGQALQRAGLGKLTTEIAQAGPFYYAETYHQQYLAKNPNGYCGLKGTGVICPLPSPLSEAPASSAPSSNRV